MERGVGVHSGRPDPSGNRQLPRRSRRPGPGPGRPVGRVGLGLHRVAAHPGRAQRRLLPAARRRGRRHAGASPRGGGVGDGCRPLAGRRLRAALRRSRGVAARRARPRAAAGPLSGRGGPAGAHAVPPSCAVPPSDGLARTGRRTGPARPDHRSASAADRVRGVLRGTRPPGRARTPAPRSGGAHRLVALPPLARAAGGVLRPHRPAAPAGRRAVRRGPRRDARPTTRLPVVARAAPQARRL